MKALSGSISRTLAALLACLLALLLCAVAAPALVHAAEADPVVASYTVTFQANGGSSVSSQTVSAGDKVAQPSDPKRTGYSFLGWYTDKALTSPYDFNTAVTSDVTLYAKWSQRVYGVRFESNGGNKVASQDVKYGNKATKPADPTRYGYTFAGWYSDSGLTKVYSFSSKVTANLKLYAKWNIVKLTVTFVSNGGSSVATQTVDFGSCAKQPTVTRSGYTFKGWFTTSSFTTRYDFSTAVKVNKTLYALWEKNAAKAGTFYDVSSGEWYYDWVMQASSRGLMQGYKDGWGNLTGYFGPEDNLTRAQVAMVLWRLAGSPSTSYTPLPDARGHWAQTAIAWCQSKGIVTGYTDGAYKGTFQPDAQVTREEFAVMVYRYAKYAGINTANPPTASYKKCEDTSQVSDWSRDAMVWCAAAGVITGKEVGGSLYLAPQETATRGQAAKIFVQLAKMAGGEMAPYDTGETVEPDPVEPDPEPDEEPGTKPEKTPMAAQLTYGKTDDGFSFVLVPSGCKDADGNAYVLDKEYAELGGKYVGVGAYIIGYTGDSSDATLPAKVLKTYTVVAANLSWGTGRTLDATTTGADDDGHVRLTSLTVTRGSSIVRLNVAGNLMGGLTFSGKESLGGLPALRYLDLSNTQTSELDTSLFAKLEVLSLTGCPLTDDARATLTAWRGATGLPAEMAQASALGDESASAEGDAGAGETTGAVESASEGATVNAGDAAGTGGTEGTSGAAGSSVSTAGSASDEATYDQVVDDGVAGDADGSVDTPGDAAVVDEAASASGVNGAMVADAGYGVESAEASTATPVSGAYLDDDFAAALDAADAPDDAATFELAAA